MKDETKPEPKKKLPYVKPVLKKLGSVRDLTHGGGCIRRYDGAIMKKRGM